MKNVYRAALVIVFVVPAFVSAQGRPWSPPRTPDGRPDLQGVWSFATLTPMERPSTLAGKQVLTDHEAAEFARTTLERSNKDRRDGGGSADVSRAYNDFWWDYGTTATNRTSLVVDPPDGRIPALTPQAQKRLAERGQAMQRPAAGSEDRGIAEWCILGFNAGPPMAPSARGRRAQKFARIEAGAPEPSRPRLR
jgi:hypothetical protein